MEINEAPLSHPPSPTLEQETGFFQVCNFSPPFVLQMREGSGQFQSFPVCTPVCRQPPCLSHCLSTELLQRRLNPSQGTGKPALAGERGTPQSQWPSTVLKAVLAKHGSSCLGSQHLGGRTTRIMESLRLAWAKW